MKRAVPLPRLITDVPFFQTVEKKNKLKRLEKILQIPPFCQIRPLCNNTNMVLASLPSLWDTEAQKKCINRWGPEVGAQLSQTTVLPTCPALLLQPRHRTGPGGKPCWELKQRSIPRVTR